MTAKLKVMENWKRSMKKVVEFKELKRVLGLGYQPDGTTFFVSGLDVATCGVANATSFYAVATKFSRLVANLASKIGDFLLWENIH